MEVLVCIKRVAATGARIPLTDDGTAIDTRHLGFTMSPHDECAVEEAVRIVAAHGGRATVLTLGPPEAVEQVRAAISVGADDGVLVETGAEEWDPQATATAITAAVRTIEADGRRFDLLLFGNESPDAGNYQVGIRVAHALGLPIVSGVKGIDLADGRARLRREIPDGVELYDVTLPAAVAVKEGLNLPRYPALKGRIRAKQADVRVVAPAAEPGGLERVRFRHPAQQVSETVVLGGGAEGAVAVADLFEELGLI
ncbi:MAG: electron transfer flavoprotein subunit beta/FixA family protein [Nitriliruptorales bacterium]